LEHLLSSFDYGVINDVDDVLLVSRARDVWQTARRRTVRYNCSTLRLSTRWPHNPHFAFVHVSPSVRHRAKYIAVILSSYSYFVWCSRHSGFLRTELRFEVPTATFNRGIKW